MQKGDVDRQFEESWRQSAHRMSTRIKKKEESVNHYDPQVIQKSLTKSYIYKMAVKKDNKLNTLKTGMKSDQSNIKQRMTRRPGSSLIIIEEQPEQINTVFNLKNIGAATSNCCQSAQKNEQVTLMFTDNNKLEIHSVIKPNEMLYFFNFDTIHIKLKQSKKSNNVFMQAVELLSLIINDNLVLRISSDKSGNLGEVKQKLKNLIKNSSGSRYQLRDLLAQQNFYKKKYKTAIQLTENCQTGDILLFQGKHFFARAQRFLTGSDFDHVGMIIKDSVYGVLIFESNSASGVCLTPWEYLIRYEWYEAIQKIVWRKLTKIKRDSTFNTLIHEFVTANLGKNYFISIDKLISNRSFIAQTRQETGYFCSQLVAKLYKDLGILTRNQKKPEFKPSCNFYPYHFSGKFDLKLRQGHLDEEYQLYFNKQALQEYYMF